MNICHLTSAHPRHDSRIFLKQCRSLSNAGHSVSLVVADGKPDEERDGVSIFGVGAAGGRLRRMFSATRSVYLRAKLVGADVYQLHDPELIPAGLRLKRLGKRVIFDAHEDLPKQLLTKPYLNKLTLALLSRCFTGFEKWACRQFDGIIAATPSIREKFVRINPNTVDINNYPLLGELSDGEVPWGSKRPEVCFVGEISRIRGIEHLVEAMAVTQSKVRLQLVGRFSEESVQQAVKANSGWMKVDYHGFLNRQAVKEVLKLCVGGLVTFLPAANHIDAQPNKMFEYMSAGVPVIASRFPLWKDIVEGNCCGLCVDPLSPRDIAAAIEFLINSPGRAEQMGRNGITAVQKHYKWDVEQVKLLTFYDRI
jgi:glycosyltransferase involved in cell wall biosynthesis